MATIKTTLAIALLCLACLMQSFAKASTPQESISDYEPLVYDRAFMDALTEEDVWTPKEEEHAKFGLPDGSGSSDFVRHIDGAFYDTYIANRWTGAWLGGDTTWVIAVARNISWEENYMYGLTARTVTILNNEFYQDRPDIRFGIIDWHEQEDIKETLQVGGAAILILKDGEVFYNGFSKNAYHYVHEAIEDKLPRRAFDNIKPVSGRLTVPGLYLTYWKREARHAQKQVPVYLREYLKRNDAPKWALEWVLWYGHLDVDIQILMLVGFAFYVLALQYYFFRYLVCESCFKEYEQLSKDVEESARTLDSRRQAYQEAQALKAAARGAAKDQLAAERLVQGKASVETKKSK